MQGIERQLGTVGVFYLARGADANALHKFQAFCRSYQLWRAGMDHTLYVIFKGFDNAASLNLARAAFSGVAYTSIYLKDDAFDLGAYFAAASRVDCGSVLFLNTSSEICGDEWLLKLAVNLADRSVGIVSCTASYEAPQHPGRQNHPFPNPHLRSNAFMLRRSHFVAMRPDSPLAEKIDVYLLEHGPESFTRQITSNGLKALLVGKNGRAYDKQWWPTSKIFRQGSQPNLLVADNQTKAFDAAPHIEKRILHELAWGHADSRRSKAIALPPADHARRAPIF